MATLKKMFTKRRKGALFVDFLNALFTLFVVTVVWIIFQYTIFEYLQPILVNLPGISARGIEVMNHWAIFWNMFPYIAMFAIGLYLWIRAGKKTPETYGYR